MPDSSSSTLFYVHDPMCSWCFGFAPVLAEFKQRLAHSIDWVSLVGGLAPDTDQPMPVGLRESLQQTWRRIEQKIPGTRFNFDFWRDNTPRRSTYPACRAVITARRMAGLDDAMTQAIQQAYYRRALNPSDVSTLIQQAVDIGLDSAEFERQLVSSEIRQALESELDFVRDIGVESFPSMVLRVDGELHGIDIDYLSADTMLAQIDALTASRTAH